MSQQTRIDKILDATEARTQEEVATLLGSDFSVISGIRALVTKAEAFEQVSGKQICAYIDIVGEVTGKSCLLISIKDAIRLGGTLIMLPDSELQEVIGREEYREELADSYGEIANIIAGAFTKNFEEMYPNTCRFVRKEQEILVPAKVEIESDKPVANEIFYLMSCSMILEGRQLGDLKMFLPAMSFGLVEPESQVVDPVVAEQSANGQPTANVSPSASPVEIPNNENKNPLPANDPPANERPKVDLDKQRNKVNKILAECQKRMSSEVSTLLGVDIVFGDIENREVSKEEFFSECVSGKQIITDLQVVGEISDTCYFSLGIKDAINLGGILIMLPPGELSNVINEMDFSDDTRDAYGEIANIVSGVYTAVFEEQYSEKFRFVKQAPREVSSGKVAIDSDDPIPNVAYYASTMHLSIEGKQLGTVHVLFPAKMLQLDSPPPEKVVAPSAATQTSPQPAGQGSLAGVAAAPVKQKRVAGQSSEIKAASEKQKKLVDKLLGLCREKMAEELGSLLGVEVKLTNPENCVVSKERFFSEELSDKQVFANMDVVGELTGKSFLSVTVRDAIRFGGILIMLPSAELESVVTSEELNEDTKDAFSEIANIISGVCTAIFEAQFTKKIRFVKTDLREVIPAKVVPESDDPIANGNYYLNRVDLGIGETSLGKVNLLFPLELLGLEGLLFEDVADVYGEESDNLAQSGSLGNGPSAKHSDILLIGDDELEAAKITSVLGGLGYVVTTLSFKDNVYNYIPGSLKAIYLVMKDVNEQAFGAAIKVSSACSLPIIAAGPGWTRTKVIKAVKYGIRDILLTPATKEDIEENVANNLMKLAA